MTGYKRPHPKLLKREAEFGKHVRPSPSDDMFIQRVIAALFSPAAPYQSGDPVLVQQVLDRAPRPDQVGEDDWNRPLRADEVAEVWGAPMEGPDTRKQWLLRADEIARAWGRPLFGPGGFLPEVDPADPRP